MTTFPQLEKVAGRRLFSAMRRRGFAVEKKLYFWRKRGPLFDVLWSEILGGGAMLRVNITILSPWIDNPETGEFSEFPVRESLIGGTLAESFPERFTDGVYDIETEEQIEAAFAELVVAVDNNALPWFASIASPEAYLAYVGSRGFHPERKFREQIKHGLEAGFAREQKLW